MMEKGIRRAGHGLAVLLAATLAGCVTPQKTLYYWGDYQPVVYSHFKGDSPEAQQVRLEQIAQRAQSRGEALPPGFNAHLGLLYLNTGQLDKARGAFEAEETLFPEAKPYMDFLLARLAARKVGDAR
ncbi:DUF4810 domain-containing protein [Solimonas sp. K1W22B-7]|uniref:DUF4810 domain-containing protein n=1 Tax=Solimonas sp. K1W22B-7 TaxID=2303331 RepID=UPI0019694E43|nr:DUF4810 domain-containing protein [Solimonas sp. K1W22B-7]